MIARRSNLRWPIRVDSICAFVADHEVVYASTSEGKQMINFSLRDLERRLDPEQFIRVRRNLIVNFAYVKEIEFNDGGRGVIRLTTGETIKISRRLNSNLHAKLKS